MSTKADLKLLGTRVSPFVWTVIWALKLKGLDYEFIEEDLSNKSPLLLEMNPIDKTVPVLVHGGKPICESLIILQYIDDTWPQNPILPRDPFQRASARFWANFSEEKLCGPSRDAFYYTGEKQAKGVETMKEALGILESELTGKKFFGGDEIGYVDIVVGWSTYWLQFVEVAAKYKAMDSTNYPQMDRWMKNFWEVPLIKDNITPYDGMLSIYQAYRKMSLLAFANDR
ncbi:glutathione transferase GST 23-like [Lycium barbarum]|uniref:glutathione transferase GST 23-like n=1 Tax=Lycium barbarum TaxID=112863 RepID=UPI00293ED81D|nr:glutathione transferase GST 23-like [Lycium barbarum]